MTIANPHQSLAIRRGQAGAADYVPHISYEDVHALAHAAAASARHPRQGQRDKLLIYTLFDGAFRVSEALRLTPRSFRQDRDGWSVAITDKGDKQRMVAVSASLVAQLRSYAYEFNLPPEDRLFPFGRGRAWQILQRAFQVADIPKPEHVGSVHVLRHSGAIARLAETGNPKAVQDHLGHQDAAMTLRYFKTLQAAESLKIQKGVDFSW